MRRPLDGPIRTKDSIKCNIGSSRQVGVPWTQHRMAGIRRSDPRNRCCLHLMQVESEEPASDAGSSANRWVLPPSGQRPAPLPRPAGQRPADGGLLQVVLQLARPRWVAQLAQRLRLDLADSLAGHVELLADLL